MIIVIIVTSIVILTLLISILILTSFYLNELKYYDKELDKIVKKGRKYMDMYHFTLKKVLSDINNPLRKTIIDEIKKEFGDY